MSGIDIRRAKDLSLITNFFTELGSFNRFTKNSLYYVFGCDRGIVLTNF